MSNLPLINPASLEALGPLATPNAGQPRLYSPKQKRMILEWLCYYNMITQDQHFWSAIRPITDERMAPQLQIGGSVVSYWLDPSEYKSAIGSVVDILIIEGGPNPLIGEHTIGRLQAITSYYVYLTFDKAGYADQKVKRSQISQISQVIQVLNMPVR